MQYRTLKKIALESVFNPHGRDLSIEDKFLGGLNDSHYYVTKALEEIARAKAAHSNSGPAREWHDHIQRAIKLLILARGTEYHHLKGPDYAGL